MTGILIVEDSPTQAAKLEIILESEGFTCTVAHSGEHALQLVADGTMVDLVISDIVMPGLSGYELCAKLKAQTAWNGVPVILLTAKKTPMDIIQGLECGADAFLTKPYETDVLIRRIHGLLDNVKLRAGARMRFGVEMAFLGRKFVINSDREQILNLLISTFEDIIHTNNQLEASQDELRRAKSKLEEYACLLEDRFRRSERMYRELFDGSADAILVVDAVDGKIINANTQAVLMFGTNTLSLIGHDAGELLPAAALPRWVGHGEPAPEHAGTPEPVEVEIHSPAGPITVEITLSFFSFGDRWLLQLVCRDISARRQAMAAREESEARLQAILASVMDAIVTIDEDGHIESFNAAACRMFGWAEAEAIGRPVNMLMAEPDGGQHEDYLKRYVSTGRRRFLGVGPRELGGVCKDGSALPIEVAINEFHLPNGRRFVGSIRDITERKRTESQLRQSQKMEAIGQLTGGIAHDFNNLLTVISGNLQLLEKRLHDDAVALKRVRTAFKAAQRGAGLTRQLLAFGRRQTLEPKVFNINEAVKDMHDLLGRTLGEGVDITVSPSPAILPARLDPSQFESAILNLCINARDAMAPDGGPLTIETGVVELDPEYLSRNIDMRCADTGEDGGNGTCTYVVVAVSDAGCGMPPEILEKVFEPFFTTKPEGRGTGLGLSMVYGFVKQSSGHVKVYSEVGVGTTFKLFFPICLDGLLMPDEPVTAPRTDNHGHLVLVVEDDPEVRETSVAMIEGLGYEVLTAEDGPSALKVLNLHSRIELLFTDVIMPGGLTGPALAREARAQHPNLKVLFTSGYTKNAMQHAGRLDEHAHLLSKPYDENQLAAKLTAAMEG